MGYADAIENVVLGEIVTRMSWKPGHIRMGIHNGKRTILIKRPNESAWPYVPTISDIKADDWAIVSVD